MTRELPDEAAFRSLTEKIARERGFGCANYKDGCLRRRIAVRMRATATTDFAGYAARLDRDPAEWELLLDALTINVTKLFRDIDVWDSVARNVIPLLWDLDAPKLNVWSAGCASGEELYTLAALFHRHAERTATLHKLRRLRILGSDIDRGSMDAARRGTYAAEAFTEVPADIRTRYFSPTAPHAAAPELKALIEVERRDLLSDPAPAGGMHLITCRNVIIYFDRPSQEPLLRRFHGALVPGGYLVLGKVETVLGPARALFEPLDARQRIFRRMPAA
jgi:chemotaxis protein methyltransferase CheR